MCIRDSAFPFIGDTPGSTATMRLVEDPASPRTHVADLDESWERVILRCLEREPERRFANARDVFAALRFGEQMFSQGAGESGSSEICSELPDSPAPCE